jgi:hypothetical protein
MAARTCRVTITDLESVSYTVEVTATTLYEAIALLPDTCDPVRLVVACLLLCTQRQRMLPKLKDAASARQSAR